MDNKIFIKYAIIIMNTFSYQLLYSQFYFLVAVLLSLCMASILQTTLVTKQNALKGLVLHFLYNICI